MIGEHYRETATAPAYDLVLAVRRYREPGCLSDFVYYCCTIEPSEFTMNKCMYVGII